MPATLGSNISVFLSNTVTLVCCYSFFIRMAETWGHVSVQRQQGKCQIWAICFMWWCFVLKPKPRDLRDTYSPPTWEAHVLTIRHWYFFVWRRHGNMYSCTGNSIYDNYERLSSCDGAWFINHDHYLLISPLASDKTFVTQKITMNLIHSKVTSIQQNTSLCPHRFSQDNTYTVFRCYFQVTAVYRRQ